MLSEKQRQARMRGVGASDAPIICGLSPWMQPRELYYQKTGEMEAPDLSGSEPVEFGNRLERVIAEAAADRLEEEIEFPEETFRHPEYPWMLCHIDGLFPRQGWLLEAKNVGFKTSEWGTPGTDEVPAMYLVQCQHAMAVRGLKHTKLVALFSGNHLSIYDIERDDSLIQDIITLEMEFVSCLNRKEPPGWDYEHPTTVDLMKRMYPGTDGAVIDMPSNIAHWHYVAQEAAEKEKRYRQAKEAARNHILDHMGDASVALFQDGSGYTRKLVKVREKKIEPTEYVKLHFSEKPKY